MRSAVFTRYRMPASARDSHKTRGATPKPVALESPLSGGKNGGPRAHPNGALGRSFMAVCGVPNWATLYSRRDPSAAEKCGDADPGKPAKKFRRINWLGDLDSNQD